MGKKQTVFISSPSDYQEKQVDLFLSDMRRQKLIESMPNSLSQEEVQEDGSILVTNSAPLTQPTSRQISTTTPFSKYDTGYTPGQDSLKEFRADNQGFLDETLNTLVEPILNAPFVTGGYVASAFLPEDFNELENAAAYSTYKWFKDHSDEIRDAFPVYKTDEAGFQKAREYILGTLQQVGESAMPFLAIGAGAGALTGAAASLIGRGATALLSPAIRSIVAANKGANLVGALRGIVSATNAAKSASGVGQSLATAYALNHTESMIEAADNYSQIYKQKYEEYKSELLSNTVGREVEGILTPEEEAEIDKRAKEDAKVAGAATAKFNKVNLLLNLTSAARFVKPIARSRTAFTPKTFKSGAMAVAGETIQEAGEETINLLAQTYGKAVLDGTASSGLKGVYNYLTSKDAIGEVLTGEGAHSAFAGALGGGIQTGITEAITGKGKKYREAMSNWESVINSLDNFRQSKGTPTMSTAFTNMVDSASIVKDLNKAIEEAEKTQDFTKVKALENQVLQFQAYNAFQHGAGEQLQATYESIRDMDANEAANLGYDVDPDSDQYYKTKAQTALNNIAGFEALYNYSTHYENDSSVYFNRTWDSYLKDQLTESEDRLSLSRIIAESRAEEIFGDEPFDLDNLDTTPENASSDYLSKLYDLKVSHAYQIYKNEVDSNKAIKDGISDNNSRFDKMMSKDTQNKVAKKKDSQAKKQEKEEKRKKEEELRKKKEEEANIKKQEAQKIKLKNLGYDDSEIDLMDDTVKKKLISKNKKKDSLPITSNDGESEENEDEDNDESPRFISDEEVDQDLENLIIIGQGASNPEQAEDEATGDTGSVEQVEDSEEEIPSELPPITSQKLNEIANKVYQNGVDSLNPSEKAIYTSNRGDIDPIIENIKKINTKDDILQVQVPIEELLDEKVSSNEESKTINILSIGTNDPSVDVSNIKKIHYAHDALAYRSRNFELEQNSSDGVVVVTKNDIDNYLNENLFKDLLDPNKYKIGTKLTLRPEPAYEGLVNDPNNFGSLIPWQDLSSRLNPNSDAYISSVPIAIYNSNGDKIGYVHDLTWLQSKINNLAFDQEFDSAALMGLRQTVLVKGSYSTEVNFKGHGVLAKSVGPKVSVQERFPTMEMAVQTPSGLRSSVKVSDKTKIINEDLLTMGRVYTILPTANGDSIAIPVDTDRMSDNSLNLHSVFTNMIVNFLIDGDFSIYENLGIPASSFAGIRSYMSNFIYNVNFESTSKDFEDYLNMLGKNENVPRGKAFFNFTSNAIEFGSPNLYYGIFIDPKTNMIGVRKTGVKTKFYPRDISSFAQEGLLREATEALKSSMGSKGFNVSQKQFGQELVVPTIDKVGKVTEAFRGKYEDFVKQITKTNYLSFNIGTEEAPKYVSLIQPVIRFDTSNVDTYTPESFEVVQSDPSERGSEYSMNVELMQEPSLEVGTTYNIKPNWDDKFHEETVFAKSKDNRAILTGETKDKARWINLKDFRGDTLRLSNKEQDDIKAKYNIPNQPKKINPESNVTSLMGFDIDLNDIASPDDVTGDVKPKENLMIFDSTEKLIESYTQKVLSILNMSTLDRINFKNKNNLSLEDHIAKVVYESPITPSPETIAGDILRIFCG